MAAGRTALSVLLVLAVLGSDANGQAQKPDVHNPQYVMGYQAGLRAERADLCSRFEKHSVVAENLLGKARMALVRAFCASRF
jgi:hypothetical protein